MDREKVIKGLECCLRGIERDDRNPCFDCPYADCVIGNDCTDDLKTEALALLKEQDELLQQLTDLGYPHNFQHEAPWVVDYLYKLTEIIKKAFKITEGR